MVLERTVEPTESPVTLDDMKAHLREITDDNNTAIEFYIDAVVKQLDGPAGLLNRALITQTLEFRMNGFPHHRTHGSTFRPGYLAFDLPLPPMQSVTKIEYIDTNGTTQTLATSVYRVLNATTPTRRGRIELAWGEAWPSVREIEQSVTVTFVAGYGVASDVPEFTKMLILTLVKEAFDRRDPLIAENMIRSPALMGLMASAGFPAVA